MDQLKYSEDEILIFSGRVADDVAERILPKVLTEDEFDRMRNLGADAAEVVMKNWGGGASVPLSPLLITRMRRRAKNAMLFGLFSPDVANENWRMAA
jgi:hypothetical protein